MTYINHKAMQLVSTRVLEIDTKPHGDRQKLGRIYTRGHVSSKKRAGAIPRRKQIRRRLSGKRRVVEGQRRCANDGWKEMRSKAITDEKAEEDVSMWCSVNKADIAQNGRN